jgi:hypothetical protein
MTARHEESLFLLVVLELATEIMTICLLPHAVAILAELLLFRQRKATGRKGPDNGDVFHAVGHKAQPSRI